MKKITIAAVVIGATFLSSMAISQGGEQKSPEEMAYKYRDSVFHALEWKSGQLGAAKASGDAAAFKGHATDMASLASMITEGFIPNSMIEGSLAKKEIWENWEKFEGLAADLEKGALALAADGYDMADFDPRTFGRTSCGGCHREYKARD